MDVVGIKKGGGRGNAYLQTIRLVDALVHIVRCFENADIFETPADAARDAESLSLELILADCEMIERRIDRTKKAAKGGDKKFLKEASVLEGLLEHLNQGKSARVYDCEPDEMAIIKESDLLSLKPIIYAANMDEDGVTHPEDNKYFQIVKEIAAAEGSQVLPICAKTEQEIAELDKEEQQMFLEELGLEQSGLDRLIQCSYTLLGLISFLTAGSDEVRAWTITRGTKAPQAAGKIHSDFERGFIRAEVIAFEDLKTLGSMSAAREKGRIRSEGKEYVMKDGDIVNFLFNV